MSTKLSAAFNYGYVLVLYYTVYIVDTNRLFSLNHKWLIIHWKFFHFCLCVQLYWWFVNITFAKHNMNNHHTEECEKEWLPTYYIAEHHQLMYGSRIVLNTLSHISAHSILNNNNFNRYRTNHPHSQDDNSTDDQWNGNQNQPEQTLSLSPSHPPSLFLGN